MSNPYLTNDPYFGESEKAKKQRAALGVPTIPQASAPGYGTQAYGAPAYGTATLPPQPIPGQPYPTDRLEQAYSMPAATSYETGRMTYDDVIMKTSIVLGLIVLFGAGAWVLPDALGMPGLRGPLMWIGLIGGLGLGLVNSFKREPSPALILAYAAFEGVLLGSISAFYEAQWDGIVLQAVIATVGTFAGMLALFKSGKVRNTPKFQRIVMVAGLGFVIFSVVNLIMGIGFGVGGGWGLRTGGLGIVIGLVAIALAAAFLVIDFDSTQKGVQRGAPAKYAWAAAFGLAVTLVWMYLEFLRLLAILRGD